MRKADMKLNICNRCPYHGQDRSKAFDDLRNRRLSCLFDCRGCLGCLLCKSRASRTEQSRPSCSGRSIVRIALICPFLQCCEHLTCSSYVFVFIYGCGVDVAGIVFYAEIYPNHLRPKGLALTVASTCLASLVYLQVAATAFSNIGWKFYLVRKFHKGDYITLFDQDLCSRSSSRFVQLASSGSASSCQRLRASPWKKSLHCSEIKMRSWCLQKTSSLVRVRMSSW